MGAHWNRIEEWNSIWVRALPGPMHLGLKTGPLCPMFCTKLKEPCSFNKVSDGPILSFVISPGSKEKEPRCICISKAKASLRLKISMTSGSKKGIQISKVPANEPPPVSQEGVYREGGPLTGNIAYLSKISSFGFPSNEALPEAPSTEPLVRSMLHRQIPFIQLSKSPVDEPSSVRTGDGPSEFRSSLLSTDIRYISSCIKHHKTNVNE